MFGFRWIADLWNFRKNANRMREIEDKVSRTLHPDPQDDMEGEDSAEPARKAPPAPPEIDSALFGQYQSAFRIAAYQRLAKLFEGMRLSDITFVDESMANFDREHGGYAIHWRLTPPERDPIDGRFPLNAYVASLEQGATVADIVRTQLYEFEGKIVASLNPKRRRSF